MTQYISYLNSIMEKIILSLLLTEFSFSYIFGQNTEPSTDISQQISLNGTSKFSENIILIKESIKK